jgi:hypothetical protein
MSDIPEALKQILRRFGWYDGYTYDTFQYEKLYKDMGCPIHESARNFLEKFGGLRGILDKTQRFNFDPYPRNPPNQGIIRNKCGIYEDEEIKLNVRHLVSVGAIHQEHIDLLVSDDGQFFGRYDHYLYFVGKDYIEAIINIYEGKITILYGDDD